MADMIPPAELTAVRVEPRRARVGCADLTDLQHGSLHVGVARLARAGVAAEAALAAHGWCLLHVEAPLGRSRIATARLPRLIAADALVAVIVAVRAAFVYADRAHKHMRCFNGEPIDCIAALSGAAQTFAALRHCWRCGIGGHSNQHDCHTSDRIVLRLQDEGR